MREPRPREDRSRPNDEYAGTAPARSRTPSPPALVACLIFGVCTLVLATYWPVLSASASSFDDENYLTDNPIIQNPGWTSVRRAFAEVLEPYVSGYYEPLNVVSLMLDYARGGRINRLRPFHQTNLVLHVANTGLVVLLLYLLFRRPLPAAVVGLLFGVHPLTVEPVALVAQRKVLLAGFFCLSCLILYVRYARSGRRATLATAIVMYALALLSKPTSTPLPVLLLLLDFWPLRRLNRRAIVEKVPFFLLALVSGAITLIACGRTSGIAWPGRSSLTEVPLTIAYLIAFYGWKMVWPARLSCLYVLPEPFALSNPPVLTGVLATCVLLASVAIALRWTRAPLTAALFFLIAIFPTMGAVGYTWVTASDKHVYLPAVGGLLALAYGLARLWSEPALSQRQRALRLAVAIAAAGAVGAEITATRAYLAAWRDSYTLSQRMVTLAPASPRAHNSLGVILAADGDAKKAVDCFREALRLDPDYAEAHYNLGHALADQGRLDEAIRHYEQAARLRPHYWEAYNNLGVAMLRTARFQAAGQAFREVLRIKPGYADAWYNLAIAMENLGRTVEAIEALEAVLRIQPTDEEARSRLHALQNRRKNKG